MKKILLLAPIYGNGGILSWAKSFKASIPNEEFQIYHVGISRNRSLKQQANFFWRSFGGFVDLIYECIKVVNALKKNNISLMHITTSGNIGTLRDYILYKICNKYKIPCIIHCHYGCLSEDFVAKGLLGSLLRKTLHMYENVWVLDRKSEETLNKDPLMKGKVFLTPNSILVPPECDLSPKSYRQIAFVGNLIPTKGLYELIYAVMDNSLDIKLTIAGPGTEENVSKIKNISGDKYGFKIIYVGKLTNNEAVNLIKSVDILALPTYYQSEAFPISILEAMSYGKLVLSTKRAAINDILTATDSTECGIFVREKSSADIVEGIRWAQLNPLEADIRCSKAYEKVKKCYSTDVIYDLYRSLYRNLINHK